MIAAFLCDAAADPFLHLHHKENIATGVCAQGLVPSVVVGSHCGPWNDSPEDKGAVAMVWEIMKVKSVVFMGAVRVPGIICWQKKPKMMDNLTLQQNGNS